MSSSSKKHGNFVSEPIGNKSVREVPGVGKQIGRQLESTGTQSAGNLMGRYLVNDQNPQQFKNWMQSNTSANSKQANNAFQGLDGHYKRWS